MARDKLFPPPGSNSGTPHEAFKKLGSRVLSVPPDEIKRREQEWAKTSEERKHADHRMSEKWRKKHGAD